MMRKTKSSPELKHQLDAINASLKKQLSFKYSFIMSIVRGVGYALGTTIVAAIVLAILNWIFKSVGGMSILNR